MLLLTLVSLFERGPPSRNPEHNYTETRRNLCWSDLDPSPPQFTCVQHVYMLVWELRRPAFKYTEMQQAFVFDHLHGKCVHRSVQPQRFQIMSFSYSFLVTLLAGEPRGTIYTLLHPKSLV